METMQFKPTAMNQYCARWQAQSPITIHNSNPQPFSVEELESITGPLDQFRSKLELDYASIQGSLQLRNNIALMYDQVTAENIVTFAGAQEAIYCSMHNLLQKGDRVVAFTPVFQPLVSTAYEIGCDVNLIALTRKQNTWKVDLNLLEGQLKKNCRLLVLNFPHNPTGALISETVLTSIIELCEKYDCWIFSDEVFRGLEHNPEQRLPAIADRYPKSISIGVFSKAFALPGIRIGWMSCQDKKTIQRALEIKDYLSIFNSKLDEALATDVLPHHDNIWSRSRNLILENLRMVDQVMAENESRFNYIKPVAGCVCFPTLIEQNVENYAQQLIEAHNLMVFPGSLFCTDLNGFRLGFAYNDRLRYLQSL